MSEPGAEKWVPDAIAQQEEYLKRSASCSGTSDPNASARVGMSHSWDTYSTAPNGPKYDACWRCRVTKTDADHQIKTAAGAAPAGP